VDQKQLFLEVVSHGRKVLVVLLSEVDEGLNALNIFFAGEDVFLELHVFSDFVHQFLDQHHALSDGTLVRVNEASKLVLEFLDLFGGRAVSQVGCELSLNFQELYDLLVLAFDFTDVFAAESTEECFLSLGVHQVDVTLEVVKTGLPVSDGEVSLGLGSFSSALVVLNHDHELVDLVLVIEVDSHVAFNSERLNSHLLVMNVALHFVEFGLSLLLLLTERVHLFSVLIDGEKEVLKLHGV